MANIQGMLTTPFAAPRQSTASPLVVRVFQVMIFLSVWIVAALFTQGGALDMPSGSVNISSVIRFLLLGGFFAVSLMSIRSWGPKLYQIDNIFLLPLLALILISAGYTPNTIYGLRSLLTIIFLVGLMFAASECIEKKHIISALIAGITTISIVSVITYFVAPNFARSVEWNGDEMALGPRLAGVCGNANNMGITAAAGILMAFFYRGANNNRWGLLVLLSVLCNFTALVFSDSRGALLSMLVGIGLSLLTRPSFPRILILFGAALFGAFIYYFVDIQSFIDSFSRTGDPGKVLTGREDTWKVAKELITQRPVWGWGYGSTAVLLPEHIGTIGFLASHTHNMILQILFSIGYVGLALTGMLIVFKAVFAFLYHDSFKMALIYMIIIHGQVEPSFFQGEANMDTLLLTLVLAIPYPRLLKEKSLASGARPNSSGGQGMESA